MKCFLDSNPSTVEQDYKKGAYTRLMFISFEFQLLMMQRENVTGVVISDLKTAHGRELFSGRIYERALELT